MTEDAPTVAEELRDFDKGWLPWTIAAVYFPLYIALDLVAGGRVAARIGFPRSVSVGIASLSVALVVTALLILYRLDSLSIPEEGGIWAVPGRTRIAANEYAVTARCAVSRRLSGLKTWASNVVPFFGTTRSMVPDGGEGQGEEADEEDFPEEWIPGDKL